MPQNTISTYLRCRPCKRPSGFFELGEDSVVQVEVPKEVVSGMVNNKRNRWRFGFNGLIGPEATQDEVFETVARPVVDSVIEGFNGTVFAYGQTGSGKTFTLTGGVSSYNERGIIPRAFAQIFQAIETMGSQTTEFLVRASYLELYNEEVRDLLSKNSGNKLELKESPDTGVYVRDLTSYVVKSTRECDKLRDFGAKNRHTGATAMNQDSSRARGVESNRHATLDETATRPSMKPPRDPRDAAASCARRPFVR